MALYLVTGGAGFIGSNLVNELLRQGQQVRILDNLSTGRRTNLVKWVDQVDMIEGDIRSYHIVQAAVAGVDYVLHQAALPSVPRSIRDPITSNEVNVMGTLNLLQAAHQSGVKRLVYASSSSIYGRNPELPKQEMMCPQPLSPYATSKLAGEKYCQNFFDLYGFETVCLRYFNVFGPRQDPTSHYSAVIPKFITAMLAGRPITVHGDGQQSRDFTFVANAVHANLLACTATEAVGRVMNIACGERFSLQTLIVELSEILGVTPEIHYTPSRSGDVPHSMADITLARDMLEYHPLVSFQEGLMQTVTWYQAHS